ncbi:response regulator transcription factor [Teichococcus oryzae]|uniref:Response regulator transcription factor n=1 Tax=Teichococcus oryzae TaxID=1608942 RepID=A0A5B2TCX5_9PROT|nr:response regulator transcription factor [Pseudoroseomonas oryzae]KAA2211925.1 response regulator transcription factor [Pseudoroseomonas oryzae]
MRILLAEADIKLAQTLKGALRDYGVLDEAPNGEEALELGRLYDYDIILLSLTLPGPLSGHEVLRRLRAARITAPVMILSEASQAQARIESLKLGADDVMSKPLDPAELLARMQAIVRRAKGYSDSVLSAGPLTLCLHSHEVQINGQPLRLTAKEYAILEVMMLRRGLVLTKQAFLDHLYGGMDEPEMKIIDVFICNLRKKLAKAGLGGLIETVWGRGYVLREERKVAPAVQQSLMRQAAA